MTDTAGADPARLAPADLDAVLDELLRRVPDGVAAAVAPSGLFVPMPPSVPVAGRRVLNGRTSALDLVVPDDVTAVIDTWTLALRGGVARADVRLVGDGAQPVTMHLVDARHRHGVYVLVLETAAGSPIALADEHAVALRPRVGTMRKDQVAVITEVDEALPLMLGWSAEELVGRRSLDLVDPDEHSRAISSWMDMLAEPGCRRRVRLRHRHKDGSWVWMEVTNHNQLDEHGHVVAEMVDITDEMTAQEALRSSEQLLRRLTETLPVGVLQIDRAGRIAYRNAQLVAILGAETAATLGDQLAALVPADRAALEAAVAAALDRGADDELEVAVAPPDGELRLCTVSLRALDDSAGRVTGVIACVADVTDSVRMREELQHRATYDPLTGCHNRASILALLDRTLQEQAPAAAGVAVVFVDLDGFKSVNDRYGHAVGDGVLEAAARRLAGAVRGADAVGRLGGDEFLVVCPGVGHAASADDIADRVALALSGTVRVEPHDVPLAASIGVAWTAEAGTRADALVACADAAMYEAKRHGRGRPLVRSVG